MSFKFVKREGFVVNFNFNVLVCEEIIIFTTCDILLDIPKMTL